VPRFKKNLTGGAKWEKDRHVVTATAKLGGEVAAYLAFVHKEAQLSKDRVVEALKLVGGLCPARLVRDGEEVKFAKYCEEPKPTI
jgi:hypothetical protein